MLKHAGDSWGYSERGPVGAPVETYLFSNWFWFVLILGCDNLNREVQLFAAIFQLWFLIFMEMISSHLALSFG
jgi:hypothetical protein